MNIIQGQEAMDDTQPPAAPAEKKRCAGQAYTEYLIILLFGVFLALGVFAVDTVLLPEERDIMDRLYGFVFDYYAGLANFLSLPTF
jgi:hypothetical protein